MKILREKSGHFYLVENFRFQERDVIRLTAIRDSRSTLRNRNNPLYDGKVRLRSSLDKQIGEGNFEELNIREEDLGNFCRENNLLTYILKTWKSKNEDNSLTYNPRRNFKYFEDSLIVRRSMFGEISPYMLVTKGKDPNPEIYFSPLDDGYSVIKYRYLDALKKPVFKLLKKGNLEYRVYFSTKDKSKTVTKYLGI